MRLGLISVVAGLLLVGGCVPSLHPLYTEEDLVFDSALLGKWSEKPNATKPGATWHFEKDARDPTGYLLKTTGADNRTDMFSAHLVRLGDSLYLDLVPAKPSPGSKRHAMHGLHYIPAHLFFKVYQVSPEFQWGVMLPAAVNQLLAETPEALKHERPDGRLVLTASPKELQEFVQKHSKEKLFTPPIVMKRVEEESKALK
ncbi:MAG: hypothetical protein JW888_02450 [Pirellulales bacterium]|nr:hypothetical protein [Pirellulales bacterium]